MIAVKVNQQAHAELERCLWSDTAFLSQLGVMDYSLLVGVDKSTNTLVVGIIDFIRQVIAHVIGKILHCCLGHQSYEQSNKLD